MQVGEPPEDPPLSNSRGTVRPRSEHLDLETGPVEREAARAHPAGPSEAGPEDSQAGAMDGDGTAGSSMEGDVRERQIRANQKP